jgi:hypothetical protein
MAVNHKLTRIIKGRVIVAFDSDLSGVKMTFKDGSALTVKASTSLPPRIPVGVEVREVSDQGTELVIGCEDETTIVFTLPKSGNAISVQNKAGLVEYLG